MACRVTTKLRRVTFITSFQYVVFFPPLLRRVTTKSTLLIDRGGALAREARLEKEMCGILGVRRRGRHAVLGARRHVVDVTSLGVLFKHFLGCVIISMKETLKNIFSWGRKAHLGLSLQSCR